MLRKIEDVFTVERVLAAFAPEKRLIPVQRKWIQKAETNGDGAGKPCEACVVTAMLLAERQPHPDYRYAADVVPAVARALDVSPSDVFDLVKGWDNRPSLHGAADPVIHRSDAWQLGRSLWLAVQKAYGQPIE